MPFPQNQQQDASDPLMEWKRRFDQEQADRQAQQSAEPQFEDAQAFLNAHLRQRMAQHLAPPTTPSFSQPGLGERIGARVGFTGPAALDAIGVPGFANTGSLYNASPLRLPGPGDQYNHERDWPAIQAEVARRFPNEPDPSRFASVYREAHAQAQPTVTLMRAMNAYRGVSPEEGTSTWSSWVNERLPFTGSIFGAVEATRTKNAADRIKEGTAEEEDYARVGRFMVAAERHKERTEGWSAGAIGNSVVDLVTHLPGFAIEFAATAGVFRAGAAVGTRAMARLAPRAIGGVLGETGELAASLAARNTAQGAVRAGAVGAEFIGPSAAIGTARHLATEASWGLVGRAGVNAAPGYLFGSALQALAMPQRVAASAAEMSIPKLTVDGNVLKVSDEGNIISNLPMGYLDQYIEVLSERSGASLTFGLQASRRIAPLRALGNAWVGSLPGRTIAAWDNGVSRLLRSVGHEGYHGVLGEMFEERIGEILRGATRVTTREDGSADFGATGDILTGNWSKGLRQLLIEGAGFAAMPIGFGTINAARNRMGAFFHQPTAHTELLKHYEEMGMNPEQAAERLAPIIARVQDLQMRSAVTGMTIDEGVATIREEMPEGPERNFAEEYVRQAMLTPAQQKEVETRRVPARAGALGDQPGEPSKVKWSYDPALQVPPERERDPAIKEGEDLSVALGTGGNAYVGMHRAMYSRYLQGKLNERDSFPTSIYLQIADEIRKRGRSLSQDQFQVLAGEISLIPKTEAGRPALLEIIRKWTEKPQDAPTATQAAQEAVAPAQPDVAAEAKPEAPVDMAAARSMAERILNEEPVLQVLADVPQGSPMWEAVKSQVKEMQSASEAKAERPIGELAKSIKATPGGQEELKRIQGLVLGILDSPGGSSEAVDKRYPRDTVAHQYARAYARIEMQNRQAESPAPEVKAAPVAAMKTPNDMVVSNRAGEFIDPVQFRASLVGMGLTELQAHVLTERHIERRTHASIAVERKTSVANIQKIEREAQAKAGIEKSAGQWNKEGKEVRPEQKPKAGMQSAEKLSKDPEVRVQQRQAKLFDAVSSQISKDEQVAENAAKKRGGGKNELSPQEKAVFEKRRTALEAMDAKQMSEELKKLKLERKELRDTKKGKANEQTRAKESGEPAPVGDQGSGEQGQADQATDTAVAPVQDAERHQDQPVPDGPGDAAPPDAANAGSQPGLTPPGTSMVPAAPGSTSVVPAPASTGMAPAAQTPPTPYAQPSGSQQSPPGAPPGLPPTSPPSQQAQSPGPQPVPAPPASVPVTQRLANAWNWFWDNWHEFAQQEYPRTHRFNREVGEALSRVVASETYTLTAVGHFLDLVMGPKATADQRKLWGTAITEIRLRAGQSHYDNEAAAARARGDIAEADRLQDIADNVKTMIGPGSAITTEAQYQALGTDAEFVQVLQNYHQHFAPELDKWYLKGTGLAMANDMTQIPGMPISIIAITANRPSLTGQKTANSRQGNMRNQKIRPIGAATQFYGNADMYETDLGKIMERNLFDRVRRANMAEFARIVIAAGAGERGQERGGKSQITLANGNTAIEIPNVYTTGDKSLYVDEKMYHETTKGLDVYEGRKFPVVSKIMGAVTKVALLASVEMVSHSKNQLTFLFKAGIWNPITVLKVGYGVFIDDPSVRQELLDIAAIHALKPPGLESGFILPARFRAFDPSAYGSRVLDFTGKILRVVANRTFDKMVARGATFGVQDTEQNRRDFINQLGNYDKRGQHDFVALLRDLGFSPFATAASTYATQGIYALTLNPGVRANTWAGAILMRAEILAKVSVILAAVALANFMRWDDIFGDEDTPFGSIKTGVSKTTGKTEYFDLLALTGITRGLRTLGLLAVIEGKRKNQSAGQITDTASNQIVSSLMHVAMGPPAQFVHTALTGKNSQGQQITPRQVPEGSSHTWENARAALLNANPVVSSITGAKNQNAGTLREHWQERLWELAGPFGFKYRGNVAIQRVHEELDRLRQVEATAQEEKKPMSRADSDRLHLLIHAGHLVAAMARAMPDREEARTQNTQFANGLARAILGEAAQQGLPNPLLRANRDALPRDRSQPHVPGGPPGPSVREVVEKDLAAAISHLASARPAYHPGETARHYWDAVHRWQDGQRQARQFLALAEMSQAAMQNLLIRRSVEMHRTGERIGAAPTQAELQRAGRVR